MLRYSFYWNVWGRALRRPGLWGWPSQKPGNYSLIVLLFTNNFILSCAKMAKKQSPKQFLSMSGSPLQQLAWALTRAVTTQTLPVSFQRRALHCLDFWEWQQNQNHTANKLRAAPPRNPSSTGKHPPLRERIAKHSANWIELSIGLKWCPLPIHTVTRPLHKNRSIRSISQSTYY